MIICRKQAFLEPIVEFLTTNLTSIDIFAHRSTVTTCFPETRETWFYCICSALRLANGGNVIKISELKYHILKESMYLKIK